jgi:D-lactate dehydrogenase
MKTLVYSAHKFEQYFLENANTEAHHLKLFYHPLNKDTAVMAEGYEAISLFVNDDASAPVLQILSKIGVKFIALRCAGYNNVDIVEAKKLNMKVSRVAAYSPYAVAEHTVTLMLSLNRKIIRSHFRMLDQNFTLDGLTGFDMHGKTVGIIGTGKIGSATAKILHGFGCRILAYDKVPNEKLIELYQVEYTSLEKIYTESDIITLHIPLHPETKYLIDEKSIGKMKKGVMLINTSRGKLIKTEDVIDALKSKHIAYLGLDVYEEEEGLFFEDHSEDILQDDVIARLMTFTNVLITSHQAFLTDTALKNIAETTIENLDCFERGETTANSIV